LAWFRVELVCQRQLGILVTRASAMLARVFVTATCLSVRPSVRHEPVDYVKTKKGS